MGIPVKSLFKRCLIITPFLLLMTIPLLFNQGLSLIHDNVIFALLIITKAFTSMTVLTILLDSQSLEQFMNSLAHLKVPPILITVLMLSYRYVFLFLEDIQKMQLAAKARFFNGGINIKSLRTYGQLTGCLLIKSLDRSEHVYEALTSRSFTGQLQFGSCKAVSKFDISKSLVVVLTISALVIIEKSNIGLI
ncbi:transmembrane component NikQ of energizing module of nickel ECF transporter [Halalkalibacter akibai JCM 9157]|uniref:Transmembrane component NikQ of energizing module of nickel ECF transporter n=2 Tax=Halalkalibacter akibai TaxID=1411 RepID=W4QQW2_HALA3|nr:transmembrane component NikQ of energizing module of nickel ECF transporter [Halalkalibacter akibai JCM 9157]